MIEFPNKPVGLNTALRNATGLAIYSALMVGEDFPVGAVAMADDFILSGMYSIDMMIGDPDSHAEVEALRLARDRQPDTVVVSIEPCINCQDYLAGQELNRVAFGLSRIELSRMGLIRPGRSIFDRADELPYEVIQIVDEESLIAQRAMYTHVRRNLETNRVTILESLSGAMTDLCLSGATPS